MILTKVALTVAVLFFAVSMVLTACNEDFADTFKRFDWVDKAIVGCARAAAASALSAFLFFVWGF